MNSGWYSLIQVCPDFARAETVNVGVYLLCTQPRESLVRLTDDFRRANALFRHTGVDKATLREAAVRISRRLETADFRSVEELEQFARSRGNAIQLTLPRSIRVDDPTRVITALMTELVTPQAISSERTETTARIPSLHDAFLRLSREQPKRVMLDPSYDVPALGTRLQGDYAYTNGRVNLVDVVRLPRNVVASERQALELNSRGEAVAKYLDGGRARLTIVGVDAERRDTEAAQLFDKILTALDGADFVHESDVPSFVDRVEREVREAH